MKTKSVALWGTIDDENLSNFFEDLIKTNWKEFSQLDLYINSYGGEVYLSLGIYDYLKSLPVTVRTIAMGKVMSGGTIIFLAGDIRECYEHTYFMVHDLSDTISGPLQNLKNEVKVCQDISKALTKIYQKETDMKKLSYWKKALSKDTHFNAIEAFEIGLTQTVI